MFRKNRKTNQLLEQLDELLPKLRGLTDRASLIDDIHHQMKLLEEVTHNLKEAAAMGSVLRDAKDITDRYLSDNHLISEYVRADVETVSALVLVMQKEIRDLNRRLAEFSGRLTH